ncbi:MAG: 50S ribosomal protein L23 [Pirellula sp.]|nr:50S ribosomal protein L23 [Pirellula sp.]
MTLTPHQIVIRPLVTEKGVHKATRQNRYAFEVNPLADKTEIKEAIEELFNVKVVAVATQNRPGKTRRYRAKAGVTKAWKKAIVKLSNEHKIDFF